MNKKPPQNQDYNCLIGNNQYVADCFNLLLKKFFLLFPISQASPSQFKLSWTHYCELLKVKLQEQMRKFLR
ncbi:MAG TPA: hypothetical protein VJI15_02505 [Candidatus Nanoarchaeia archaeon]|nr:hypothetical protein [Candidatus Nanoarchaeia archaeon]